MLIIIVVALAAISTISIFLAYMSLQSTESRLELAATQELRRQISTHVTDESAGVGLDLDNISRRLEIAASSPILLGDADSEESRILIDATRVGIEQYAIRINYLDSDGIILYTTETELAGMVGSDSSDAEYYTQVRERNEPTLTGLFTAADNRTSVSVAVPVSAPDGSFNGVLAAIIPTESIVDSIAERLPFTENSQVFLVATDGAIIGHQDGAAIGGNVSDKLAVQNDEVSGRNLQLMTVGRSGVFEYTSQDGVRMMASYSPVTFSDVHVWSVLITTPALLDEAYSSVLSDQRVFTIASIVLIVIIAAIFMAFIITLNSRLHRVVQEQDVQIRGQLQDIQYAYERLTEQERLKDEFINVAAHELRTPVLPIMLSAEGLADDLGRNDAKIEIILRNAKRINKLTNDILDVSRIKSNTFRLQKEMIDIQKLSEEAIQDALFKIAENKKPNLKIAFESKLPEGRKEIVADSGRLGQVLSNLLDNAVNFTDKGMISVTLQQSKDAPGSIEVRVADTGSGIDPAIRPRLFEKFATKSEHAKGTGLGLYLCKAIVEAHGGGIWVEDNVGGGTVFAFRLPADA